MGCDPSSLKTLTLESQEADTAWKGQAFFRPIVSGFYCRAYERLFYAEAQGAQKVEGIDMTCAQRVECCMQLAKAFPICCRYSVIDGENGVDKYQVNVLLLPQNVVLPELYFYA